MPGWWNGRHEGLKILWLYGCAGSSPASGTLVNVLSKNPIDFQSVGFFVFISCTTFAQHLQIKKTKMENLLSFEKMLFF